MPASCLIIPAFRSMAKSRSTVRWVSDNVSDIYTCNHTSPPPKNSHRLPPVFAVLSVLGFIDDGRLQDFDRVPGAGGNDAAVTAGGRAQDNACRFMEATPNCHALLLFNAISRSLFLVKHLDQFSMKQQDILGTVRMPMNRDRRAGKKSIEHSLAVVVG